LSHGGVIDAPGPGFSGYKVYRSIDGAAYSLLATVADRTTNYYTDSSISGSDPYYYKMYAEDSNGNSSYLTSSISAQADGIQNLGEGGGGFDTIAPNISSIASSGQTTQSITITWTTNELSNSAVGYCTAPCSDYSVQQTVSSYVTSHSVTVDGLTPDTTYNYAVFSTDPSGNTASTTGLTFSTSAGPTISGVSIIDVSNETAQITWNTDIAASGYVVYATNTPPSGNIGGWSSLDTIRTVTLTGLDSGTKYYFYVKSQDGDNNWAYDYNVVLGTTEYYSFTTSSDSSAPVITSVALNSTSATTTVVSWITNEPATSQIEYGTESAVYGTIFSLKTSYDTSHFITLSGLSQQTPYYFRVASVDQSGNSASSTEASFTTLETQIPISEQVIQQTVVVAGGGGGGGGISYSDYNNVKNELLATNEEPDNLKSKVLGIDEGDDIDPAELIKIIIEKFVSLSGTFSSDTSLDLTEEDIAPAIESLRQLADIVPATIITGKPEMNIGATEATIRWKTDKKTNSVISYAVDGEYKTKSERPYVAESGVLDEYILDHEVVLSNLSPSTTYHFQIKTRTEIGDWVKTRDYIFTTRAQFPRIIDPRIRIIDNQSVAILWTTNIPADSVIKYTPIRNSVPAEDESETFGKPDIVKDHIVTLKNLEPANMYDLEILSTDPFGNIAKKQMPPFSTIKDKTSPVITHIRTETTVFPGSTDKIQTIIFWDTDEPSTSQVLYDEVSGSASAGLPKNATKENEEITNKHTVVITEWHPGAVYRFRAISVDSTGNEGSSKDFMVVTPQKQATVVDLIISNFSETFGWTKKLGL